MLSNSVTTLQDFVNAANGWRDTASSKDVDLFQVNATFPDGRPVVLKWDGDAIDNGDGTYTGAWIVVT